MKHYEVSVKAVAVVFVADAKTKEEAFELAREALDKGDFDDLEMQAHELTSDMDIAASCRHADAWSAP